jgi:hypothetical protein
VTDPNDRPPCVAGCRTRPQAPGILLCLRDAERLGEWLARLDTEFALLDAVPSMQGREPDSGGRSGLASQRSPAALDVLVLRDRRMNTDTSDDGVIGSGRALSVYGLLHRWAEYVREERNLAYPVAHIQPCSTGCMHRACWRGIPQQIRVPLTVLSERKVLATNLEWLMQQEDQAAKFYADMRQLWSLLKSSNSPEPRTARRVCACGGYIRWRDGAAECGLCGTRTTGLDVVRQQTEGAVA